MSDRQAIGPGREADVLALLRPFGPGREIAGGVVLQHVAIEPRRVRLTLRGPTGARGALLLVHPEDAPPGASAGKSFASSTEANAPELEPAVVALRDALARNDDGTFWRGAPLVGEPLRSPSLGPGRGALAACAAVAALALVYRLRARSPTGTRARPASWAPEGALAGTVFAMAWTLRGVETDDAYAVLRYVQNLLHGGGLVYNLGERICALTSPLHALALAALGRATGELVVTNRLFGIACSAVTLVVVARTAGRGPSLRGGAALAGALVGASPYFLFWTFGGLETPLLGALVTALTALSLRPSSLGTALGCAVLGGLALATRLDALVFVGPLVAAVALRLRGPSRALPVLVAAVPPLAWAAFARSYYGDALPTSFYVKAPRLGDPRWLLDNALYSAELLLFSGVALSLAAALLVAPERLRAHLRERSAVWLALAGVLAYGLVAATTHLFYAFRLFAPYLGPAALVVGELWGCEEDARPRAWLFALVLSLQWLSFGQLASPGGNLSGARNGEMRDVAASDASEWVRLFARPAEEIRRDWQARAASLTRPLRLATVAQGSLPFALEGAIVYEQHAAYRHRCRPSVPELASASDYVAFVTPYPGEVALPTWGWEPIFEAEHRLGGVVRRYRVFYNPAPSPPPLPPRVDDPCPGSGDGAALPP